MEPFEGGKTFEGAKSTSTPIANGQTENHHSASVNEPNAGTLLFPQSERLSVAS